MQQHKHNALLVLLLVLSLLLPLLLLLLLLLLLNLLRNLIQSLSLEAQSPELIQTQWEIKWQTIMP
jgi:hypothetical protein